MVSEALGLSELAWQLAQYANSGLMKKTRAAVGPHGSLDYGALWAEAEALIRTGWEPD